MICGCRSSASSKARAAAARSRRSRPPGGPTCRAGSAPTCPITTRRRIWASCRSSRSGSARSPGSARRGMAASHYSMMTKETSALFVAGPPVVNALTPDPAQHLDRFQLGGWEIQTRCGAVDHAVDTEEEAFDCTRRFLSYLPSSVFEFAAARPANRRSRAPRRIPVRRDPARPPQGLPDAPDRRGGRR